MNGGFHIYNLCRELADKSLAHPNVAYVNLEDAIAETIRLHAEENVIYRVQPVWVLPVKENTES